MLNRIIAFILPYFPERFIWIFSKKYIAGQELDHAIKCIENLREENCISTVDVLGESVSSAEEAELYLEKYLQAIQTIGVQKLEASFSIKPTMFGLQWDKELCYRSVHKIVSQAASKGHFVRIDMEDSSCTSQEIELFEKLYKEFPVNVGIVLQAYLKRTLDDLDYLKTFAKEDHPVNIRLCKGIYIEPKKIAYKSRAEIRENYLRCLEKMLLMNFYPALATHDRKLIYACIDLLKKYRMSQEKYEFQMLLGVTPRLRKELVDDRHQMRVYVPYGEKWFRYATRRLQENPTMVWDIISGILVRK